MPGVRTLIKPPTIAVGEFENRSGARCASPRLPRNLGLLLHMLCMSLCRELDQHILCFHQEKHVVVVHVIYIQDIGVRPFYTASHASTVILLKEILFFPRWLYG